MAFHDVVLPESFSFGSAAGPTFATIPIPTASGHEFRVANQAQPKTQLSLTAPLQTVAQAKALQRFAIQRRGSLHSFKVKDHSDFTTNDDGETDPTNADQILGTGDGVETTFQLLKTYGRGEPGEFVRTLRLPWDGTVLASLDNVGTSAFTVNGEGEIVFATPPGNGVIVRAGCKFYVPVRFAMNMDQWTRLRADAYQVWSIDALDLIEVLDEVQQPERLDHGGGRNWFPVSQDVAISFNDDSLQRIAPSVGISAFLPPPEDARTGPHVFVIHNAVGSAGSIQVREDDGTALGSPIAAGEFRRIMLCRIDSTTSLWLIEE